MSQLTTGQQATRSRENVHAKQENILERKGCAIGKRTKSNDNTRHGQRRSARMRSESKQTSDA